MADDDSTTWDHAPLRVWAVPAAGVALWAAGVYLHAADPPAVQHMTLTGQLLDNGRFPLYAATFVVTLALWLLRRYLPAVVAAVAGTWLSAAVVLGPLGRYFGWLTVPYVCAVIGGFMLVFEEWEHSPAGDAARERRDAARTERERAATEARLDAATAAWTTPEPEPATVTAPVPDLLTAGHKVAAPQSPEPGPVPARVVSPGPAAERAAGPAPARPAPRPVPRPARPPGPDFDGMAADTDIDVRELRVIWGLLCAPGGTTVPDVARKIRKNRETARTRLTALGRAGYASREGSGKATRYYARRDAL